MRNIKGNDLLLPEAVISLKTQDSELLVFISSLPAHTLRSDSVAHTEV